MSGAAAGEFSTNEERRGRRSVTKHVPARARDVGGVYCFIASGRGDSAVRIFGTIKGWFSLGGLPCLSPANLTPPRPEKRPPTRAPRGG